MVSLAMTVTAFLWSTIRVLLAVVVGIGVWHRLSLLWQRWRVRGETLIQPRGAVENLCLPSVTVQ
jgi:hypothetical protein